MIRAHPTMPTCSGEPIDGHDSLALTQNPIPPHDHHPLHTLEALDPNSDTFRSEVNKLVGYFKEREKKLVRENEEIRSQLQNSRQKTEQLLNEKRETYGYISENLEVLKQTKKGLLRFIESLSEGGSKIWEQECEEPVHENGELCEFFGLVKVISRIVDKIGVKFSNYEEKVKKEKRELENSVVSLKEENRDISSLLRIALAEKEAAERSLNRLKMNNEQRRGAILQIAERGLQKVGFGFLVGDGTNEHPSRNSVANSNIKSDSSEFDEEVVSVASTVERMMKKLRMEATQLRCSLEESRSDNERLQSLTEKQAQELVETMLYIKALEDREKMLSEYVEKLLMAIKENEEEVVRWREACELEVEAGRNMVEERDKLINILTKELEKTRAALNASDSKLKLKDELVGAAIVAQEAAERSLQVADSRAAELCRQIEEMTKQLEEAEKRELNNRRRARRICWPWQFNKLIATSNTTSEYRNVRRRSPAMQALLH